MHVVSFYEISDGNPSDNYVRVGTGTVEEVRGMERPACYLCLHGSFATDQPMPWVHLGTVVLDKISGGFKDIEQEGLERRGAPASLVFNATSLINGALAVVRAFADEVTTAESEHWFAVDASHDFVTPVTEQNAWNALACAGPSDGWGRISYISVKGPQDDLRLLFDRIVADSHEEQRQAQMDTDFP